jgi:two-component system nitrogen regulation response regulator NtrX
VKATVLVVDDESNITAAVAQLLELEGYQVIEANCGREGLDVLEDREVDIVLLDVKLPDLDGLSVLREIKKKDADLPVVMMSAYGTIETAVEATKAGAYDFLEKPLGSEKTLLAVENALRLARLSNENIELRQRAGEWPSIIGRSRQMKDLFKQIEMTAPTSSRVLLLGESGTGKELVARAIHDGSPRRDARFVTVNCAAVPAELIESELFGHERGAFTGASKARRGKFELADGGTLLLDEVGDMPLPMQAKLLRVLEEGEIERVGGDDSIQVNVRVVAASNKNLEAEVKAGNFRLDLFHRLNVVPIELPPLREREGDIALLAEHFLGRFSSAEAKSPPTLSDEAMDMLESYSWPGNIRELRNIMERLAILFPGKAVFASNMAGVIPRPERLSADETHGSTRLKETMRSVEKAEILKALEKNKWHMTRAAEELGLERSHLYKKMKAHGISRD